MCCYLQNDWMNNLCLGESVLEITRQLLNINPWLRFEWYKGSRGNTCNTLVLQRHYTVTETLYNPF